ncbi:hypothetical protein ACLOJK_033242 [Asimina triloba]
MVGAGSIVDGSILRQLSSKDGWKSSSKRWAKMGQGGERSMKQMEGLNMGDNGMWVRRKRLIVVVDHSTRAKDAMMWALTHVANKGDLLTLLEIIPPREAQSNPHFSDSSAPHLAYSLGSLCKASKPEVSTALPLQLKNATNPEIQKIGAFGKVHIATVISQVKKLEASVLVLGQKKPSSFSCLGKSREEEFVEQCINNADCLTLGVRKQSRGIGGYLISTRWQKNFWLLA